MVGVPKSRGCLECIRVRVKCDEAKPDCKRCGRFGRQCPGYARTLKFVDGAKCHWSRHSASRQETGTAKLSQETQTESESTLPRNGGSDRISGAKVKIETRQLAPRPLHSSAIQRDQIFGQFINDAVPDEASNPMRQWLATVYSAMGRWIVLDDAVNCLLTHYSFAKLIGTKLCDGGNTAYIKALQSLQKSLNDVSEDSLTHILCATSVLSVYELFVCTEKGAWIKHAGGIARLLQVCGATCFCNATSTAADSLLLRAFRGQIIMEAFMQDTDCFLAQLEWNAALKAPRSPDTGLDTVEVLSDELYAIMVHLPALKRDSFCHGVQTKYPLMLQELIREAARLKHQLAAWHTHYQQLADSVLLESFELEHAWAGEATFKKPFGESDMRPFSSFKSSHDPDITLMSLYTNYHGSQILVNNAICRLSSILASSTAAQQVIVSQKQIADLKVDNEQHALAICRITPLITGRRAGYFGPYFAVFGLRMAYSATSSDGVKAWVTAKLQELAGKMKVVSSIIE